MQRLVHRWRSSERVNGSELLKNEASRFRATKIMDRTKRLTSCSLESLYRSNWLGPPCIISEGEGNRHTSSTDGRGEEGPDLCFPLSKRVSLFVAPSSSSPLCFQGKHNVNERINVAPNSCLPLYLSLSYTRNDMEYVDIFRDGRSSRSRKSWQGKNNCALRGEIG